MLTAKDEKTMRGLVSEIVRDALIQNNEVFGSQLKREIRDEMHAVVNSAVFASEERLGKKIDTLRDDILDLVKDEILPQIEKNRQDIVHLKIATNIA
ncbi:MAG: hypothetical protein AAB473_04360 [Patescibacteria group bacterium]